MHTMVWGSVLWVWLDDRVRPGLGPTPRVGSACAAGTAVGVCVCVGKPAAPPPPSPRPHGRGLCLPGVTRRGGASAEPSTLGVILVSVLFLGGACVLTPHCRDGFSGAGSGSVLPHGAAPAALCALEPQSVTSEPPVRPCPMLLTRPWPACGWRGTGDPRTVESRPRLARAGVGGARTGQQLEGGRASSPRSPRRLPALETCPVLSGEDLLVTPCSLGLEMRRGSCLEGSFWSIPSLPLPGPAGRSTDRCRGLLGVGVSCPPCALSWGQQKPPFSAQSLLVPELQGLPCLPWPAWGDRALLPDSSKAGVEPHPGPSSLDPARSLAVAGRCRAGVEDTVLMRAQDSGWFCLPRGPSSLGDAV